MAALVTVVFEPVVERWVPGLGSWTWIVAGCFAVLLYASVLVHELGHAMAARAYGLPVHRITLQMLGGVTETSRKDVTPGRQFVIAGVGPLLSLLLGARRHRPRAGALGGHRAAPARGAAGRGEPPGRGLQPAPGSPAGRRSARTGCRLEGDGQSRDGHRRRRVDRAGPGGRPRRRAGGHLLGPRTRTRPPLHRLDGPHRRLRLERSRSVAAGRAGADQASPAVRARDSPARPSPSSPTPRSPRRCASSRRAGLRPSSSWTARTSRWPWSARRP